LVTVPLILANLAVVAIMIALARPRLEYEVAVGYACLVPVTAEAVRQFFDTGRGWRRGLGLKSAAGLAMIERLIPEFDVLYENFRPGVMDRLGLSYERCERGAQPAHHLRVGHGIWAGRSARRQAWSGRSDRSPHRVGSAQQRGRQAGSGRIRGGRHARGDERCIRNACAIVHAVRTGEGQLVRTSLYESAIAGMAEWGFHVLNAPADEPQRPRPGHASPYTPPPYAFYATKDGYIALSSGRQIGTLSRILGIDDLSQDDRFAT
jgi:succinate--hydroxymethylglutarate CoA-transferase